MEVGETGGKLVSVAVADTIARLRELSLADPNAIAMGTQGTEKRELLEALVSDISAALADAENKGRELLAEVSSGPSPLAFVHASAKTRRSADSSIRGAWPRVLEGKVGSAVLLATLWSAAAEATIALIAADNALVTSAAAPT